MSFLALLHPSSSHTIPPAPPGTFHHPVAPIMLEQKNQGNRVGQIPLITVDQEVITDAMAASLATSLVGHVLFLKNQVPFPVMQLARIPRGTENSRAVKMRHELVGSFDTLTSHLGTTFTALSTALALAARSYEPSVDPAYASQCAEIRDAQKRARKRARAYLAIMVGPSIGSARAKVLFAVDGLEVKVWGERDDDGGKGYVDSDDGEESESESEDEEGGDEEGQEEDSNNEDDSESTGEDIKLEPGDEPPSPPSSRSPSPSPSLPNRHPHRPHLPSSSSYSYADEQRVLRAADRLLSRVLADADSEGRSMACEMAPTQTHILIRAPRRFAHPAWVPRQNMTGSLDGMLGAFMDASDMRQNRGRGGRTARTAKGVVEGVWVKCKGEWGDDGEGESEKELDEMIWWSWDGKIVGFRDCACGQESEQIPMNASILRANELTEQYNY